VATHLIATTVVKDLVTKDSRRRDNNVHDNQVKKKFILLAAAIEFLFRPLPLPLTFKFSQQKFVTANSALDLCKKLGLILL
jgi:hypothetical protein